MTRLVSLLLLFSLFLVAPTNAFTIPSASTQVAIGSRPAVVGGVLSSASFEGSAYSSRYFTTGLKVLPDTFTELPEKLYLPKEKEIPKVLGGLQMAFGSWSSSQGRRRVWASIAPTPL